MRNISSERTEVRRAKCVAPCNALEAVYSEYADIFAEYIRVIQRLLGHRSLRSTEVYTHVAENYVADTKSPLDDLLPDVEDVEPTVT